MKTILFYLIIASLQQQPNTPGSLLALGSNTCVQAPAPIKNLRLSISDDRIFLDWSIEANQEVDQFAIERSTDGKIFYPAGLVFSSEKNGKENYTFFEKIKKDNAAYRILIIYKDHIASYSPVAYIQTSNLSTN